MSYWDQSSGDARSAEAIWEKLSQVAVQGAEHDSPERQPHSKCLEGTRVNLLNHIYGSLDNQEGSPLIWLHGTAGVGKSAVAFTVAERMRGLNVTEQTTSEKRLAGTFFFSRKYTRRLTTGYFFATLAYQLASNFPSIRHDMKTAIRENPALLDPKKSVRVQMEELFVRPLRELRLRLRECPPLVFVVDALDECTSETEIADLVSLLGHALRKPDLPVIHILLTSRSEAHIREAIQDEDVRPLVCEIPVQTSGEGVSTLISLEGADVDKDIYIFLKHSFTKLRSRSSIFPQPTGDELAQLASRAGRRFIVASTMMKFIDDGYNDPRKRLQLMLKLTSKLLPGTEVYKFYDHILSTCAIPKRAYLHLSVVAALADPLPISQIVELLGPGEGRDVGRVLAELRSVMDIPTDSNQPVNISHSSLRDYVSNPSNCGLFKAQSITPPHSLLAYSSLCLMVQEIPESTGLSDALLELQGQSQAIPSHDPQGLRRSLTFIVQPPEPLRVLITLLWLRGDRSSGLQSWLDTLDGRAWMQTRMGRDWLKTLEGKDWLQTQRGRDWLRTQDGRDWLQLPNPTRRQRGRFNELSQVLGKSTTKANWRRSLRTLNSGDRLQRDDGGWLNSPDMRDWLQTPEGHRWLQSPEGQCWLQTLGGQEWLQYRSGDWLQTQSGRDWLQTPDGQAWQSTPAASFWAPMEEFSNTVEAISEFTTTPESSFFPVFRTIEQFKNLPDFLMLPAFLALSTRNPSPATALQRIFRRDMEIVRAVEAFVGFANGAQKRSRSASDALAYACQNWAMHLSRALNPWDDALDHIFEVFWDYHLLPWLERQWCLKGLRSCLVVLSEGRKLAKGHL